MPQEDQRRENAERMAELYMNLLNSPAVRRELEALNSPAVRQQFEALDSPQVRTARE